MARYSSSASASLRTRLSSFTDYLDAVSELHTKLLASSPSYIISDPEELISLIEVAKSTLQRNGVSLHTFSSCPDSMSAYKTAYFGILLQLQAQSHNARLGPKDLQVRLNRLLFPLSTQLRVCTKSERQLVPGGYAAQSNGVRQPGTEYSSGSTEMNPVPRSPVASTGSLCSPERSGSFPGPPNLPPNVMLPPPAPLRRSMQATKSSVLSAKIPSEMHYRGNRTKALASPDNIHPPLSSHRGVSRDTMHFKRRHGEPIHLYNAFKTRSSASAPFPISGEAKSRNSLGLHEDEYRDGRVDDTDSSGSSSEEDNSDGESGHVVIPSNSPLRRTFGIFCTGKGRGAFSGSVHAQRRRQRPDQGKAHPKTRKSSEGKMDIEV